MARPAYHKAVPFCRRCLITATTSQTRYGERCTCPRCGSWSWGRKPLADKRTHDARRAAHEAFDPLWKDRTLTRGAAYRHLQVALGLSENDCHMATMDAETALKVPAAVEKIRATLDAERMGCLPPVFRRAAYPTRPCY